MTIEENLKKANIDNISSCTGGYSSEAQAKKKVTLQKRYGRSLVAYKGDTYLYFSSIGEAARYFSVQLDRTFSSCKAQIIMVLNPNNRTKTLAGYAVEDM